MTLGGTLEPLNYHRDVAMFLQSKEPEVWKFFASNRIHRSNELRADLLRSTYRLDATGHGLVVEAARAAANALGVTVPVSIYQTEGESGPNAMLVFVPEEAIILLSGPILDLLNPLEQQSVFGHELTHHLLWTIDNGAFLTTDRMISAMIAESPLAARVETGRRLSLATELYADAGALLASGDLDSAVGALVKTTTGLRSVAPTSYLAQAEEVVSTQTTTSSGVSHPESFLRALAMKHRSEQSESWNAWTYVSDGVDVDRLDLLDQKRLDRCVSTLIDALTESPLMKSLSIDAHKRAYYPEARPPEDAATFHKLSKQTLRLLAFVALDFAKVDTELDHQAVVHAGAVCRTFDLGESFESLLTSELKLKGQAKRSIVAEIEQRHAELLAGTARR
jgi:hypothetical protein